MRERERERQGDRGRDRVSERQKDRKTGRGEEMVGREIESRQGKRFINLKRKRKKVYETKECSSVKILLTDFVQTCIFAKR